MSLFLFAQVFGIIIFIFEILCIISTKKKNVLIYNTFTNIFSFLQYLFLEAYSGVYAILVTFVRNFIFSKYDKNKKKIPFYWIIIIFILLVITNIKSYNGILSIIPLIVVLLYTFSIWKYNVGYYKIIKMFVHTLLAVYNFYCAAYAGFITQIIFILICAHSYTIYKKKNTKKEH